MQSGIESEVGNSNKQRKQNHDSYNLIFTRDFPEERAGIFAVASL
jgi:hypothetical protein